MPSAYIETTIPSYYTARRARSVLQMSRQIATQEWWDTGCSGFDLFTSTETLNEAGCGNAEMAKERLKLLEGIEVLKVTKESIELARFLVKSGLVPEHVAADAIHISIATVYEMDFLVTWNFKHIANPHIRNRMRKAIQQFGAEMPVMCTPEEFITDGNIN